MNYDAIISRVHTRPHPYADRIQCGTTDSGETVIVGKDTADGEVGIYFPVGSQLSEEYCRVNDLVARYGADGKKVNAGYFNDNRRVRAQSFRGVQSYGLWMPLSSLRWATENADFLAPGQYLTELNGHPLCGKYETPGQRAGQSIQKKSTWKTRLTKWLHLDRDPKVCGFPEHNDTPKLGRKPFPSEPGHLIVTEKIHGTSHRVGKVFVTQALPVWKQLVNKFVPHMFSPSSKYEIVHGTRRTVLYPSVRAGEQYRMTSEQWSKAEGLYPDEILYGEIVGYNGQRPIMPDHNPKTTKVVPNFSGVVRYRYGCVPSQCQFYVYRITWRGQDLLWLDMKDRAYELGFLTVPEIASVPWVTDWHTSVRLAYDKEHPSALDSSIPREGVVIRVETANSGIHCYKDKTWAFQVMEGTLQDSDSYVDPEDVA